MSRTRSLLQRLLAPITEVHRHELDSVLRLTARIFLVLLAYYLLKPTRETLILADGSAELRSYAVAAQAAILILALPLYSAVFRRQAGESLYLAVTLFFVSNLLIFYLLGMNGFTIGFVFFVWLGIFNITQIAQFWALAADLHTVESGKRLFALIALGGSLGALAGSQLAKQLFEMVGPYNLFLLAGGILIASALIGRNTDHRTETRHHDRASDHYRTVVGGIGRVLGDPYLRLVALFVVLLNCINSTGEFILARMVVAYAEETAGLSGTREAVIGAFYSDFFFWVNLLSLFFQLFLVSRLFRWIGIHGALVILPLIATVGYALIVFLPIFAVIRSIKILENSSDYSIQNTTRHALFLPVDRSGKYEGKTTIDTLFWRMGDLIQAGIVFIGTTFAALTIQQFAAVNLILALAWVWLAVWIWRHYVALTSPVEVEEVFTPEMKDPALEGDGARSGTVVREPGR